MRGWLRWLQRRREEREARDWGDPHFDCPMCGAHSMTGDGIIEHARDYHVAVAEQWGVRVTDMDDYVVPCESLQQADEVQAGLRDRGIESRVVTL